MKWSNTDEDFLKSNYHLGSDYCSKQLSRTKLSVAHKMIKMNLRSRRSKKEILSICHDNGMIGNYTNVDSKAEFICKFCNKKFFSKICHILSGHTKSCGCFDIKQKSERSYTGGKYITGEQFSYIKSNAKNRNIKFEITIQDIEEVYDKQNKKCALSGIDLIFNSRFINGNQNKIGYQKIIKGNASVDRIDSKKHYTKDNIQIIDKKINFMKHVLSLEEFLNTCKLIVNNLRL